MKNLRPADPFWIPAEEKSEEKPNQCKGKTRNGLNYFILFIFFVYIYGSNYSFVNEENISGTKW